MNRLRLFSHLVIFVTCLAWGFWISSLIPTGDRPTTGAWDGYAQAAEPSNKPTEVPTLPNGQRSLLVVVVDQVRVGRSELQGVWLALYVPTQARLTLLPVFPSLNSPTENRALAEAFALTEKDARIEIAESFLEEVRKQDLWWSGYILLDQKSLEDGEAQEWPGGEDSPSPLDEPQKAILSQAHFVQQACQSASFLSGGPDEKGKSITGLLSSNLNSVQLWDELRSLQIVEGRLQCEFPTLSMQSISLH